MSILIQGTRANRVQLKMNRWTGLALAFNKSIMFHNNGIIIYRRRRVFRKQVEYTTVKG